MSAILFSLGSITQSLFYKEFAEPVDNMSSFKDYKPTVLRNTRVCKTGEITYFMAWVRWIVLVGYYEVSL